MRIKCENCNIVIRSRGSINKRVLFHKYLCGNCYQKELIKYYKEHNFMFIKK